MINSISINGYKCFLSISHSCSCLNILVGANASGKSSFLQALLLLRQSITNSGVIGKLILSGSLVEAGTARDILHPSSNHAVTFLVCDDDGEHRYDFYHDRSVEFGVASRELMGKNEVSATGKLFALSDSFAYLNSERIGPRVSYSLPDTGEHPPGLLGKHGEYTAGYLSRCKAGVNVPGWEGACDKLASAILALDGIDRKEDLTNTEGRIDLVANLILGWILPGASFDVTLSEESDSASTHFLRDPLGRRVKVRATHIGFGLTYALPIIVSVLSLSENSLFLVENPEAHLHPFSQSRLGAFLAIMSELGRQIFVETHSDHFVNGVRLAIKSGLARGDSVSFAFFEPPLHGETAEVTSISVDDRGILSQWPRGFFDQIESDLSRL